MLVFVALRSSNNRQQTIQAYNWCKTNSSQHIKLALKWCQPYLLAREQSAEKWTWTRVKIGGGLWGLNPHWKTDNPHCKRQGKKAKGVGFWPPLGPDSCECIHYDIVSFSLFILQCFHNLFCTIFVFIFWPTVRSGLCHRKSVRPSVRLSVRL